MFKRITYIILFMGLSGLLFANERHTVSLSLTGKKCIRNTAGIPPSADDFVTVDYLTNYFFVRNVNNAHDNFVHYNPHSYLFFGEKLIKSSFSQKTLNFFKSGSIF